MTDVQFCFIYDEGAGELLYLMLMYSVYKR